MILTNKNTNSSNSNKQKRQNIITQTCQKPITCKTADSAGSASFALAVGMPRRAAARWSAWSPRRAGRASPPGRSPRLRTWSQSESTPAIPEMRFLWLPLAFSKKVATGTVKTNTQNKHTNTQTNRQRDRQTDRQTKRHTHILA